VYGGRPQQLIDMERIIANFGLWNGPILNFSRAKRPLFSNTYGKSKTTFGFQAKGRDVIESGEEYQLRESPTPYKTLFEAENEDIASETPRLLDIKVI